MAASAAVVTAVSSWPLGRLTLVAARVARRSSSPRPYLLSAAGLTSTRTAGSEAPPAITCPTPSICDSFCTRMLEAASYIWPRLSVSEVSDRISTGASAGLTLR